MNNEVKLDKELIKFVNKFFKININKLKFLTKTRYGKDSICLVYSYEGKMFGFIITHKNMITFCELISSGYNSPIITEYENELLKLALNLHTGMVFVEYCKNETKISTMSCNPKDPNYGNKEYIYKSKMFDVDKTLIISKLEGF